MYRKSQLVSLGAFVLVAVVLMTTTRSAQADLIGWWKFDETSDNSTNNFGTRADSGPNGLTLSLSGSSYSRGDTGVAGNALLTRRDESFDNANNQFTTRLNAPDNPSMDVTSFSFSAFVDPYVNDVKVSLFGRQDTWGVEIINDGTPKFNFYVTNGTGDFAVGTSASITAEAFDDEGSGSGDGSNNSQHWFHLAGTYDSTTGTATLYVDGTNYVGVNAAVGTPGNNANSFYVGSVGFLPGMLGLYDSLQLYGQALTPSQVAYLGANPAAIIPTPSALPAGMILMGVIVVGLHRRQASA